MTYADRVLEALGDPTRRAIFLRLRAGARSVAELAEGLDVSRPAVSQHLTILKAARLAKWRAEGARHLYALDRRGVETLREWLDGLWDQALVSFKIAAEREATREGRS